MEEDIAHSLANVSEERRAQVLETFRNLERRNELLNQQRGLLIQDIDSFVNDLASMGVGIAVARSSTHKYTLNPALWSTLPLDLLQIVFAHLPFMDIIRLRVLSTTWDRYVMGDIPGFTKLVMDGESKCYRVFVVCSKKRRGGGVIARVFSSVRREWRSAKASEGLIFGYRQDWGEHDDFDDDTLFPSSRVPCVYNCANGKLVDLDDGSSPWKAPGVLTIGRISLINDRTFAFVKDGLFVLHKAPYTRVGSDRTFYRYFISEYQAQRSRPHWVKLRDHTYSAFACVPSREYMMHLYACNDFLLVTANNGAARGFQTDLAWVYELSSGEWQAISGLEVEETDESDLAMFELQWDVVP